MLKTNEGRVPNNPRNGLAIAQQTPVGKTKGFPVWVIVRKLRGLTTMWP